MCLFAGNWIPSCCASARLMGILGFITEIFICIIRYSCNSYGQEITDYGFKKVVFRNFSHLISFWKSRNRSKKKKYLYVKSNVSLLTFLSQIASYTKQAEGGIGTPFRHLESLHWCTGYEQSCAAIISLAQKSEGGYQFYRETSWFFSSYYTNAHKSQHARPVMVMGRYNIWWGRISVIKGKVLKDLYNLKTKTWLKRQLPLARQLLLPSFSRQYHHQSELNCWQYATTSLISGFGCLKGHW